MNFNLSTESGFYGDADNPSEEYFRVGVEAQDFSMVIERAIDSSYDVTVRRPSDLHSDQFLENIEEDPEVYANSGVVVVPEFPVGGDDYHETKFMMYRTRPSTDRQSDAIVDIFLDEGKGDEKIRWVNREKDPVEDDSYTAELWYIGTELRDRPVIDHLSQDPLDEKELDRILQDAEALIDEHEFRLE